MPLSARTGPLERARSSCQRRAARAETPSTKIGSGDKGKDPTSAQKERWSYPHSTALFNSAASSIWLRRLGESALMRL
jgi:hypothetical protein